MSYRFYFSFLPLIHIIDICSARTLTNKRWPPIGNLGINYDSSAHSQRKQAGSQFKTMHIFKLNFVSKLLNNLRECQLTTSEQG